MIGVIADDLTGAAEIGAVGLRHGLRAEIVRSGKPSGSADLICVDTDSRSCDPAEAAKRAVVAAKILQAAGATWIYKKVDSVLRGHVTAEVEAVMRQFKLQRALILPANPSLGRVIRDGQYFVKEKLIHLTEFARDPEHPRRTSQVLRLITEPQSFLLRLANGHREVPSNTLLLAQADSPEHVQEWAAVSEPGLLPVGGSEFFAALLKGLTLAANSNPPPPFEFTNGPELFVCGTASQSAAQLIKASKSLRVPVFQLPQELVWGAEFSATACQMVAQRAIAAFAESRRVVLCVGLPHVRDVAVAKRLSSHLVDVAQTVLANVRVANVFAEGGATAAALIRRMNWPLLEVRREWAPGVATLTVAGGESALTIKPGSYAWPEQWTHAL
jgi:hypothetical protein